MKKVKPTTPGQRQVVKEDFSPLTKNKLPEKSLLLSFKTRPGRSRNGRITVRHRGGGAARLYRAVDFKQDKYDMPGKVMSIEYDPNRTAFIALVQYPDGERRYILAPQELKASDTVITGEKVEVRAGNRTRLKYLAVGTPIHNIELEPGSGGKLARGAGTAAQVLAYDEPYALVKMPSKEVRKIHGEAFASIGFLSRPQHRFVNLGKAGRKRWKGFRPTVRGSAMSAYAHPHGGGEGKAPIGLRYPKTPWGKHAMGVKTRRRKHTNFFIIERRKK